MNPPTKLEATIKHMLGLPDTWNHNVVNDERGAGYSKGWVAALESLARRMGVKL